MKDKDQEWALFWCSFLHPVLYGEVEPEETHKHLKELAGKERLFPNGTRKKPSLSTLKRKLRLFREGGFEALARKPRNDRGKPRVREEKLIERAVEIKRDQGRRSHIAINKFLKSEHEETIPKSSLYRYLKAAGATRLKLGVSKKKVRGRWTRDYTHALWVGDFEEGPYVFNEGQAVQTHLCAFIDCYSRYLVEGRYYFRQNLDILMDSLLRAWATHGASGQIYVDQAKVFKAKAFKSSCYALDIRHTHRGAGDPPPGGLIERFFEATQDQFEAEVRAGDILTLEQLNRAFSAWPSVSKCLRHLTARKLL